MPNKYCNLPERLFISDTYTQITAGFAAVEADIEALESGSDGGPGFGHIAVSGQDNVTATEATDTLTLIAGTGVAIATDKDNKTVTITATGSAAPAAHAAEHITGGTDIIPNAVANGSSGLMSGADKAKLGGLETDLTNLQDYLEYMPIDGGDFTGQTEMSFDGGAF